MTIFILGLILFLGIHSVRIFSDQWRSTIINKIGEGAWKILYSIISTVGLIFIVLGYGDADQENVQVWSPPIWTWHITALLNILAFLLLTAAYVPKNALKTKFKDPMILGVKIWAFAHLISNGSLNGIILFGSFLIWAILDYRSFRKRRLNESHPVVSSSVTMTFLTIAIGVFLWMFFAFYGHQALIGINPLII